MKSHLETTEIKRCLYPTDSRPVSHYKGFVVDWYLGVPWYLG